MKDLRDLKDLTIHDVQPETGSSLSIQEQPLHRNVLWYRGGLVFETLASLSLRLKELLGPVTRVKTKTFERKLTPGSCDAACSHSRTPPPHL